MKRLTLISVLAAVIACGCGSNDSTITEAGSWEKPKGTMEGNVEKRGESVIIRSDPNGGDK